MVKPCVSQHETTEMFLGKLTERLDRIEDKLEKRITGLERLAACLESITDKIKDLDKISKERIGEAEQNIRVLETNFNNLKLHCTEHTAGCPKASITKFTWLIVATCLTTMGGVIAAIVVALIQYRSTIEAAAHVVGGK